MDFIPYKEADKLNWYSNLLGKIDTEGPLLGLTAAEVTQLKSICNTNNTVIKDCMDAQTNAQKARATKEVQLKNGDKDLRILIRKMKTSSGYTDAKGTDLQIVAEDADTDYATYKPMIKATVMPGKVRIEFIKDGLDGVNVYSRFKGQANWTKLAFDSYSPYEDTRALAMSTQAEHREYMAIGVLTDEEVTQQSDIIEAVFGG